MIESSSASSSTSSFSILGWIPSGFIDLGLSGMAGHWPFPCTCYMTATPAKVLWWQYVTGSLLPPGEHSTPSWEEMILNGIKTSCPTHGRKPCALHPLTSSHTSSPSHLHPPFQEPTSLVEWRWHTTAVLELHGHCCSGYVVFQSCCRHQLHVTPLPQPRCPFPLESIPVHRCLETAATVLKGTSWEGREEQPDSTIPAVKSQNYIIYCWKFLHRDSSLFLETWN